MLEEISISGLGVIDKAGAEFHEGLTVLTGETGAGKTMVVTSLHLLSGARADAGRVRSGQSRAVVEGRFRTTGADAAEVLDASGAELDEDGTVIAVRTVNADGRSRAHLGGRSVPVGLLGQFTSGQLAIHGQNDQLRLLRSEHQRDALDRFSAEAITKPLKTYREARERWITLADQLRDRQANSREIAQESDRLKFGLDEIDKVAPQPHEDEEIAATVRRLSDLETIRTAAVSALDAVTGAGPDADVASGSSVLDGLGAARTMLETQADDTLRALLPRIEEALTVVGDIGEELSSFVSGLPVDAAELEQLLQRQAELKSLVRKYAPDIDGVIGWADSARSRLAEIGDSSESLDELAVRVTAAREDVAAAAVKLTKVRVKAAKSLASKVSSELTGLAMGDAQLEVSVVPDDSADSGRRAIDIDGRTLHAGSHGVDKVEFGLTAHAGAQARPIAKSASGGELSRVMLALEVVLAGPGGGSTMVFDEVDAGVGGRAAVEIGRRLAKLARAHQVIVVTHLPQVAAFADNHLLIGKQTSAGKSKSSRVTSSVEVLDRDERVAELARMLAGLGDSDTGRAHAEELLSTAENEKTAF
ncbi:DNA replication and repair protein RecN [Williamsia limnetica]|uniref:DNA repair protein RecN n=1 Tax=Williamsia limnetica TaxID=882452 RepID=A0A318S1F5_WILLI|nr:DNA repair protein RecN [Williamsia limnetica]PYE20620.1 DNA replication and repair protein RecN [Williamsia limnetica]